MANGLRADACPAYILAGGQSRRFGADKALWEVDGQPQLLRLTGLLSRAGHPVKVVGDRADRYQSLGIECLVDAEQNCGPMSGLLTALRDVSNWNASAWLLLCSCDQLFWFSDWFDQLVQAKSHDSLAVVFQDQDATEMLFPLPGLFHTALEPLIAAAVSERELSIRQFLRKLDKCTPIPTLLPPSGWSFNTQTQLKELLQLLDERGLREH